MKLNTSEENESDILYVKVDFNANITSDTS